jgi:hypothetical protein
MERNVTEVYDKIKGRAVNQAQSDTEPIAWREALEQQLSDLVELARDTRSDKGGAAQWTHPIGALVSEFAKRIAPPRPDASAGLIEASCLLDKRADENKGKNDLIERAYRMAACFLRARAADRSMT